MGREVRRVPANWQHPIHFVQDWRTNQPDLRFRSLLDGNYVRDAAEWDEANAKWSEGLKSDYQGGWKPHNADYDYTEYAGERPNADEYMPAFPEGTATHYMMYETTSEGSPISPAFATPEELARWLADNNASAFGGQGASYESWLRVCYGGYAPSMVIDEHGMHSGVEALTDKDV